MDIADTEALMSDELQVHYQFTDEERVAFLDFHSAHIVAQSQQLELMTQLDSAKANTRDAEMRQQGYLVGIVKNRTLPGNWRPRPDGSGLERVL